MEKVSLKESVDFCYCSKFSNLLVAQFDTVK